MPRRKIAKYLVGIAAMAVAIGVLAAWHDIRRIVFLESMFSGADEVENFRNMRLMFPAHEVHRAPAARPFAVGTPISLPKTFAYHDRPDDTQKFLSGTDTTGLLIVKDDKIVFEHYWLGNNADSRWEAWSVSKSFVSALVGIAVQEGAIKSIEDPLTRYAPELRGTAYEGVSIKDALQMASGVRWNEDYGDPNSDVNRLVQTLALGRSLDAFVATMKREYAPGSFRGYNSLDTLVLGRVLQHATGQDLADYLAAKLWVPLGMESDAYWTTDGQGKEWGAAGLNATLRDFAKLGRLYLSDGQCDGVQIVSADWIRQSVLASAPHLPPGPHWNADSQWGYGYQWWVVSDNGAYAAVGIYNQFVYVSPASHLIIAKTSANHAYGTNNDETSYREGEHIAFFKALESAVTQ